jgi:hypothetical protein
LKSLKRNQLSFKSKTNIEKANLIKQIIDESEYKDIQKTLKQKFSKSLKKDHPNYDDVLEYLNSFDMKAEIEKEFTKLHIDDIKSIIEVSDHPTVVKLERIGQEESQKETQ